MGKLAPEAIVVEQLLAKSANIAQLSSLVVTVEHLAHLSPAGIGGEYLRLFIKNISA